MLGNDIDTGEVTITVDGLLVAHTAIYDLDEKMAHFDVTGEFSKQLGIALAKAYDKNVARSIILAARTAADGPFPGGERIVDAALTNSGTIDGKAWIDAIREANIKLFDKDVPEDQPRYMTVNAAVFDAMKYATDANGRYLVLDRDINAGAKSITGGRIQMLDIEGVTVIRSRLLPNADESAETSVYPKYRADYSKTTGILWTPMAIGTLELMGVSMETERDVRRQEDFMVAKMAVGSGTLRPECAVEFAVA